MAETGIYVRIEREGKSLNLDLTQMTKPETEEWIRYKQKGNPNYDIECIVALTRIFREQIQPRLRT